AEEKVKSGNWKKDDSLSLSQSEYNKLLPDGVDTINNYLFSIIDENNNIIGMIWINKKDSNSCFIYDIYINDKFQGKGYGLMAMKEVENFAKSLGAETIGLHVFGHNNRAIKLYEKLGYKATNISMSKKLY
ncbi:MAG: GNAT family N-acetyltransferase, partial [Clostridium sp.]|uniref:GNAT family N-acetyltransferase n=1 Tax=Clostridium sp. TaxID=1506 RepID=UPI002912FC32